MLEANHIYCGDCLEVAKEIVNNSIDLVLIDPPYCSQNKARIGTRYNQSSGQLTKFDDMSERIYRQFMKERLSLVFDKMKIESHVYVFVGWKYLRELMDCLELSSFRINKILVWDLCSIGGGYSWRNQHEFIIFGSKGVARPVNDRSLSTVLRYPRIKRGLHPFEKPVGLIKTIVLNSTKKHDVVLDMFSGSGTTAVACINTHRNFIGIDISREYCDIAEKRIKRETEKLL